MVLQGVELCLECRDCLFEHRPMRWRGCTAELVLEAGPGQLERVLPVETSQFLRRTRRADDGSAPSRLFLLRFHLFGFEAARHAFILRHSRKCGIPVGEPIMRYP